MARTSRPKSRRQYQAGAGVGNYISPQLCELVKVPPRGPRWVHETKFDGYRMQMHVRGGNASFYSRSGIEWTHRFPEIAAACSSLDTCILDGEVRAIDKEGMPSFSGLTDALSAKFTAGLVYFVFDLIWGNSEDLSTYPLETRKKVLAKLVKGLKGAARKRVHYVEHHAGDGAALLEAAARMKLEGIVSKVRDAPYKPGERSTWTKSKCRPAQEVVVGGWKSAGSKFSSLLLGAYVGGKFVLLGTPAQSFNRRNLPGLQGTCRSRDRRPAIREQRRPETIP
jgi:bifunctional non-homologous end joining protein LigD